MPAWGRIFVAMVGLLLAAVPTAFAKSEPAPPDIAQILDRGRLVVAMYHTDTPPFYFTKSDGSLDGFDVQLIAAFARRMGVRLEFNRSAASFEEVVDLVARGEADLAISKLSRTFSRSMRVRFTQPYLVLRQGLLVNRLEMAHLAPGEPVEKVLHGFQGRIGVVAGSSYEDFARQHFPAASVVALSSWDAVLEATARGDVTAAYRDEMEIKKLIRSSPSRLINLQTVVLSDTRDPIAIAVNWRSPNLLSLLNAYLDERQVKPTADAILDQYMPEEPRR